MKKLRNMLLCALMLMMVFVVSCAAAEATEADFAITLTADLTEVNAGQKITLTAEFANPETVNKNAKNNQIVWTVTDEAGNKTKAASVNQNGVVATQRNVKEKTVLVVTATAKSMPEQTASVKITVIPVASKVSIQTDAEIIYLQEGYNTARLTAAIEPADAAQAVTWQSANEKVATVDENGVVTAVSAGTVNISATAADGSKAKGSIRLTVGIPVSRINSVSYNGMGFVQAGKGSLAFSILEFLDAEGNKINPTNKNITWSVQVLPESAQSLVSIDEKGKLTASKECPPAAVTVTAAADGSLPAGSATYSVTGIYVVPAAAAEVVPTASMDDFWGTWDVLMIGDAKGNVKDPSAWMNKLGAYSVTLQVMEMDGKPAILIYINDEFQTGYYVHQRDNALYISAEQGEVKAAELCADGTLLEYVVSIKNDQNSRVYCYPTSREKQSNSQGNSTEGSGTADDAVGESLLDAVAEATGGIPDTLRELEERYDLAAAAALYDQLAPLVSTFWNQMIQEETCSLPARDVGVSSTFSYFFRSSDNSSQEPEIKAQVSDSRMVLTSALDIPEDCDMYSLELQYADALNVSFSRSKEADNLSVGYKINGEVDGLNYHYSINPVVDGHTLILITYFQDGNLMHTWYAQYDENGMLEDKTFV